MPRIPKHRQELNPPIEGYLVNPTTKVIYRGEYVRDYRGRFYEGVDASFNENLLEFVPYNLEEEEDNFTTNHRVPTERDYESGFFQRYFIQDLRNNEIIEVDQDRFTRERTEKKIYRRTGRIEWLVKGQIEDYTFENGYTYPGIFSQNLERVRNLEKTLPGIGLLLNNPTQFVREE